MIIFKLSADIHHFILSKKNRQITAGLVPTMGALHAGHLALIKEARKENSLVISSIFVNPTQFNDPKDFEKYPNTIENDIYLLEKAGCDILFLPAVKEMYPDGLKADHHYDLGYLETILEGKFRPGHFQGVCQVVHKLLNILIPDRLYLGQKDLQQCMVIKKMTEMEKLEVETIVCPTQREKDGLAMSSRNLRLNETERTKATGIYETLQYVQKELVPGSVEGLKQKAGQYLTAKGFKVDYVEIADAHTLEIIKVWDGTADLAILVAAFINEVRLIDNRIINHG